MAGRVTQYSPAHKRLFDEVKAQVRAAVVAQRSIQMARDEAQRQLVAWKASPDAAKLGAALIVSRNQAADQSPVVVDAALKAAADKLPSWQVVDVPGQGAVVLKVNKVLPAEMSQEQVKFAGNEFAQLWAAAESKAYFNSLKTRYKVSISPAVQAKLEKSADKSVDAVVAP